jgi:hypothetical protein
VRRGLAGGAARLPSARPDWLLPLAVGASAAAAGYCRSTEDRAEPSPSRAAATAARRSRAPSQRAGRGWEVGGGGPESEGGRGGALRGWRRRSDPLRRGSSSVLLCYPLEQDAYAQLQCNPLPHTHPAKAGAKRARNVDFINWGLRTKDTFPNGKVQRPLKDRDDWRLQDPQAKEKLELDQL